MSEDGSEFRYGQYATRPGFIAPRLESTPAALKSPQEQRSRAARFVASAALSGVDAGILLDMLGLTAEEGKLDVVSAEDALPAH